MKSISLILSLMSFVSLFSVTSHAQLEPVKVPFTFSKMYAPNGFDSNDMVQIVGEGVFKNACYRHAETKVIVDDTSRTVTIEAAAYEYSGLCLQVLVPFERTVDIGILKSGKWDILQGNTEKRLGTVVISTAVNQTADDFQYAPVSQAFFQQVDGRNEVLLSGEFTNSCLVIQDVKVSVEPEAIVIQPIAQLNDGPDCKMGRFPFLKTLNVGSLKPGKYLLHVRSMNGNAVNTIVSAR